MSGCATIFTNRCCLFMKNVGRILFILVAGIFTNTLMAQVSVYGFYSTYTDPSNPIVLGQYEAISGEWLEWDTLGFCDGVVMGSSAFDAGTESYMFAGIGAPPSNNGIQFWDYDVIDNAIINNPSFNQTINAIQHDMAGDRLLALGIYAEDSTFIDFGDGTGYWEYEWGSSLIELDTEGSVTSIAPIEGINGVVLGATAFDPENNVYALVGMDNSYNQKFIQLDGTTGEVISSVNLNLASNMGFNELECFIAGESFIGLKRPFGAPTPNTETTALVSVDPLTGVLTNIVELPQIYAFSPNASVFEQMTGLFIMLYYDVSNQSHIVVIDPVASEVVADHEIDGSFIELQINNREFMLAAYGAANDVAEVSPAPTLSVWPNPATTQVQIHSKNTPYRIHDQAGRLMVDWSQEVNVDATDWSVGSYFISCANGAHAQFTVVQ